MADERDPDLDIAIGEDAFRAGFKAALVYWGLTEEELIMHTEGESEAWSAYTPPEELCGGGPANG